MSEAQRFWSHEASNIRCVREADFDRVTAERDALQQRLTAADERVDVLEGLAVKQAALLDELGIPLDELDDLFGETLKNANRYEYLRSVMAVENFPNPHPVWSEPSEVESKRIDDLCDAALKPAEGLDRRDMAGKMHLMKREAQVNTSCEWCAGCGHDPYGEKCEHCRP